MPSTSAQLPTAFSWLHDVREVRQPLEDLHPIFVRHGRIADGPVPPQPAVPAPQRHPYCEFNLVLEGLGQQFVQNEQMRRRAGTVLLLGPGIPHYALILKYPHVFATIYFLPSLLLELGPERDGPCILARFTARQTIARRVVWPPPVLRRRLAEGFQEIIAAWEHPEFGSEVRMRTTLLEMLVDLVRWEEKGGQSSGAPAASVNWNSLDRALRHLRNNYAEEVYAHDLAVAAGVTKARLQVLFREALGMPWVQYLQAYRIHRAALMIAQPSHTITEAAMDVGFSTLSHFNAAFRRFMGLAPTEYIKRIQQRALPSPERKRLHPARPAPPGKRPS